MQQFRYGSLHGVHVHVAIELALAATLEPRLQEVLVEGVAGSTQRNVRVAPVAVPGINVIVIETSARAKIQSSEGGHHLLDLLAVHRLAGNVRQVIELETQRSKLG